MLLRLLSSALIILRAVSFLLWRSLPQVLSFRACITGVAICAFMYCHCEARFMSRGNLGFGISNTLWVPEIASLGTKSVPPRNDDLKNRPSGTVIGASALSLLSLRGPRSGPWQSPRADSRVPLCCHCEAPSGAVAISLLRSQGFVIVRSFPLVIARGCFMSRGNLSLGVPNTLWVPEIASSGQKASLLAMTVGGRTAPALSLRGPERAVAISTPTL